MNKILSVLNGEHHAIPPVWLMRQAGRYLPEYRALRQQAGGFMDLVYNPALAAAVTLQPVERFGFDAAILFSDILIVPHALGADLCFGDGEGPQMTPFRTLDDLKRLDVNNTLIQFQSIYETVDRVKSGLDTNKTAFIGFAGAPWTVAAYMLEGQGSRDYAGARQIAHRNPELMEKLLDIIIDATADYLAGQVAAGVQAVQVFDSWAGVLDEADFNAWVIAPTRQLVRAFKARCPAIPVIGFPRGAAFNAEKFVQETNVTALQLDTMFPAVQAQQLARRLPVQGWLDPAVLLAGGKTLETRVLQMKTAMRDLPYIFNLGHGIIKDTPVDNVARLLEVLREQ